MEWLQTEAGTYTKYSATWKTPTHGYQEIFGSDNKIKFNTMVKKMMITDIQDNQEQDEHHRARSRRAPSHSNDNNNINDAVPNITDNILELARNSSTGNQAVGVFIKWKRIKNEDKSDVHLE